MADQQYILTVPEGVHDLYLDAIADGRGIWEADNYVTNLQFNLAERIRKAGYHTLEGKALNGVYDQLNAVLTLLRIQRNCTLAPVKDD